MLFEYTCLHLKDSAPGSLHAERLENQLLMIAAKSPPFRYKGNYHQYQSGSNKIQHYEYERAKSWARSLKLVMKRKIR